MKAQTSEQLLIPRPRIFSVKPSMVEMDVDPWPYPQALRFDFPSTHNIK